MGSDSQARYFLLVDADTDMSEVSCASSQRRNFAEVKSIGSTHVLGTVVVGVVFIKF